MSAIIGWFVTTPWAWLAVAATVGGVYLKIRHSGAKAERDRQDRERQKARDIRDDVQNDVGAMPPDAVRNELAKRASK